MSSFKVSQILLIFILFILLDSIYLFLMKNKFDSQIKLIQGSGIELNISAAVICYISLVFGVYYFIIREKKSLYDAFLLGIVIYAVYETTNLALIKKWSPSIAIIDTLWGGILFTLVTAIIYNLKV